MFKEISGKVIVKMHCVGFFIVEMTIKKVDVKTLQKMRCIICYNNPILIINAKTQAKKC